MWSQGVIAQYSSSGENWVLINWNEFLEILSRTSLFSRWGKWAPVERNLPKVRHPGSKSRILTMVFLLLVLLVEWKWDLWGKALAEYRERKEGVYADKAPKLDSPKLVKNWNNSRSVRSDLNLQLNLKKSSEEPSKLYLPIPIYQVIRGIIIFFLRKMIFMWQFPSTLCRFVFKYKPYLFQWHIM